MERNILATKLAVYIAVVYFWLVSVFTNIDETIVRFSFKYFSYVIPCLLLILCCAPQVLRRMYSLQSLILLVYFVIVIFVSLLRGDFTSIFSTILLIGTMLVILNSKLNISLRFINVLFLLSIIGSIISTHLGINKYGYLPGVWEGRISLFPGIPESSFLCVLVIVTNYYFNLRGSRFVYYGLALYFLLFSGSKTGMVLVGAFILFVLTHRLVNIRHYFFYSLFTPTLVIFFLVFINIGSAVHLLKQIDNPLLTRIIFNREYIENDEIVKRTSSSRVWIWENHLRIFASSPLTGVGTFSLEDYSVKDPLIQYTSSTGSESFLTGLFARYGVISIFVLIFFFVIQHNAIVTANQYRYFLVFLFLFTTMVYGSYIVPYNFLFLLVIILFKKDRQ